MFMPAGRESKRVIIVLVRFRCNRFSDRGAMFFGRSLQSAAAPLVYACQRVGRAHVLNLFVFCACTVPFSLTAGPCFRGISTIRSGAFGILCMSAGREGELGEPFLFAL